MPREPSSVLEARDVAKRVKDGNERREVLRSVSLVADAGDLIAITGPSGSGKTTLLGVLGAMLLPTSGEVLIDGEVVSRLRDHHRAEVRRRKVGYLFQDFALVDAMTVLENVLLPLVPDGRAGGGKPLAIAALDRLGVADRARDRVGALSGGERQRVALARALVTRPILLLLDEPTAHLDAPRADALMADLLTIAKEGAAIVLASHDPRVVGDARVSRIHTLDGGVLS